MSDFERENRYLVIKRSDIDLYLSREDKLKLLILSTKIESLRMLYKRDKLKCVVVENDWPEYELVWEMIEERMKT